MRRTTRVHSTGSRTHTITLDLMMELSDIRMKNEEAHIGAVRDDEDIDNGDVGDDKGEEDDEDKVI